MLNVIGNKLKKHLALIIGTFAMLVSATSTSMCILGGFYEPEMPKSLYEIEE